MNIKGRELFEGALGAGLLRGKFICHSYRFEGRRYVKRVYPEDAAICIKQIKKRRR